MDPWRGQRSSVSTARPSPECRSCQLREFPSLAAGAAPSARLCGRDAIQVQGSRRALDLAALEAGLVRLGEVRRSELALRFACPPHEITVFPDGRAIVKGTTDPAVARSLYSRYIGD